MHRIAVLFILFSVHITSTYGDVVGQFQQGVLDGWEVKKFKGQTEYTLVEEANGYSLQARSDASASALYKAIKIDLTQTPYLNWSWRVDSPLNGVDETTKQGDDYAARVYVVRETGMLSLKSLAISYVWSSYQKEGSVWPNAFTDNAAMIAVRNGDVRAGQWISEKRNVREDFKRAFGRDIKEINVVALMTDTDNSGQSAQAYYGNISFTAD
ncbi:MAG: DUF3047 domain-containing protein [Gammaproteobacteria bacterium]|nr:DUF3047 domain-containing protein [Gammaproteobacteria bacterium]